MATTSVQRRIDGADLRIPPSVRSHLEALFDADLTQVGVRLRAESASAAYAEGETITLRVDGTDPFGESGLEVLGHEIAHVLQQRRGRVRAAGVWRGRPVNRDTALEAEAAAAGSAVAAGEPVRIAGGTGRPVAVRQFYTVIAPAAHAANGVAFPNPVAGAAGAPGVTASTFVFQLKGGALALSPRSFLNAANNPNLHSVAPAATTLRLSTNGRMAIQDADLNARQPKVFYATAAVVATSNARLALFGSKIRLDQDPPGPAQQRITVNGNVLVRTTPRNVSPAAASAGFTMDAEQQCDALVGSVIGGVGPVPAYEQILHAPPTLLGEYHLARELLPAPPPVLDYSSAVNLGTSMRAISVAYANLTRAAGAGVTTDLAHYGINQFAAPTVGEGFVSSSLLAVVAGGAVGVGVANAAITHEDHLHLAGGAPLTLQKDRVWGNHWGGVVAQDGTDVLTMENYARATEDALQGSDTRFYFQMYNTAGAGAAAAQSWHGAWSSTPVVAFAGPAVAAPYQAADHEPASPGAKAFANPITQRVTLSDARFDAIAAAQYPAANVDPIKDDHNLIAGAANAHQEILQVLKGLRYANVRLAAGDSGKSSRINNWLAALGAALHAGRFAENRRAIIYAHHKVGSVPRG